MEHQVLKPFVCKVSGEFILSGTFVCDDYKRVNELHDLGFIRKNDESEKLKKPSTTKKVTRNAKQG